MSYSPDLDAYFARIGYLGSRQPTLETLREISFAHVTSIPFEALDVLLGIGVDLDPRAVEEKLVARRRGGYCFEQNSLLLHVLTALGFQAQPISARVRWGRTRDYLPARTHMFLRVELDGASWLADVGIGSMSLTSPLLLQTELPQPTRHETRRLIAEGSWDGLARRSPDARLFHQVLLGGQWLDVCELTLEEMAPIDREVANWYTSMHPTSHFRDRLMVAKATQTGRVTLTDRELTRRGPDGLGMTEQVSSPAQLLEVLRQEFGLELPEGTRFATPGLRWE